MVRTYSSRAWCLVHIGLRPAQPSPPSLPPLYLAIGVASQPFSVPLLPSLFPVPCSLVPSGWVAPGALCVAWVPPWIPTRGDHGSYATTTTQPHISEEEQTFPRPYRTTLAQLRSGFFQALNSYMERVGRSRTHYAPSAVVHPTSQHTSSPVPPTPLP